MMWNQDAHQDYHINLTNQASMFRIGLFAKMNRVTIKALRYYDEAGLVKPEFTDRFTNYRYYTTNQIEQLHKVIALKNAGFSIKEIQTIIQNNPTPKELADLLEQKLDSLEEDLKEQQARLNHTKAYLTLLRKEPETMNQDVIIKALPEVTVASKRVIVQSYDDFFQVVPAMGEVMKKQGARCAIPEYCFSIFHDGTYKESDIDVEICEAVIEASQDSDGVAYKEIAAVPQAACLLHKGPYSTIGNTYAKAMRWIQDNGYEMSDNPRESYLDGIWNKEDPAEWLTEIQVPVREK